MSQKKRTKKNRSVELPPATNSVSLLRTVGCGFAMGIADIVPGVSGGTVALVLGIYQRLITAISKVDREFLGLLKQRKLKEAATHIDLFFLFTLMGGIAFGMVAAVLTISKHLANAETRPYVLAIFFGLVVGSIWIVFKMIGLHSTKQGVSISQESDNQVGKLFGQINWIAVVIGAVIAGVICWMSPGSETGALPLWYVFLSGMVAICAMILPGISGALILLLLGAYAYVVGALKDLLHRESIADNLLVVVIFAGGCLIGLLTFSKILKRLLETRYNVTMSLLCGLMIGSLLKLWPYQRDLTPEVEEFKHKAFQPSIPTAIDSTFFKLMGAIALGTACVFAVHHFARSMQFASAIKTKKER